MRVWNNPIHATFLNSPNNTLCPPKITEYFYVGTPIDQTLLFLDEVIKSYSQFAIKLKFNKPCCH